MNPQDPIVRLARLALGDDPTEEDGLALMVLLHTHRIELTEAAADRLAASAVPAATQRQSAELVAAAWPPGRSGRQSSYEYWYVQFNRRTPFEVLEDVPAEWRARVEKVKAILSSHSAVAGIAPED